MLPAVLVTNIASNPKETSIATDMLKESVDRLNINSQNSDFRKNASNVLAAMLEARMKKKQQPPVPQPHINKFDDPEFLPPPPIPSNKPQNNNTCHDQDLPLPPPPSPCKIPSSILTPPLSSDENDLPMKKCYKNSNCNNPEKVNYRHKKHHHSSNQSPDSSPASSTSSFHGISKPELSTHARDRRSYIEKNNNNNNSFGTNGHVFGNGNELSLNNSVDKDTLDTIANGIANGQHPVCDKCKCKITRYVYVDLRKNIQHILYPLHRK